MLLDLERLEINMTPKLTKEHITTLQEQYKEYLLRQEFFVERFKYIVTHMFDHFGMRLDTFEYEAADDIENEGMFPINSICEGSDTYSDNFEYWSLGEFKPDFVIIDKNGEDIELAYSFPSRWFFEDFEEELKDGKELFLKSLEEDAKKLEDNKKGIKAIALSKLSIEEKKALGLI